MTTSLFFRGLALLALTLPLAATTGCTNDETQEETSSSDPKVAESSDSETVVARYKDREITMGDVEEEIRSKPMYSFLLSRNPNQVGDLKKSVLNAIINRELLLEEIKKNVNVPEKEIEDEIQKTISGYGGAEKLKPLLEGMKTDLEGFTEQLREELTIRHYVDQVLVDEIQVSEDELKTLYSRDPGKFAQLDSAHARHILLKTEAKPGSEEDTEVKKRAEDIFREVSADTKNFATYAEKYSEGPTAPKGGDLGTFSKGTMVPEFETVAFSLQPGEISPPVRSRFGYHIIYLEGKKEGSTRSFEEARPLVVEAATNIKKEALIKQRVEELRKKAQVQTFL